MGSYVLLDELSLLYGNMRIATIFVDGAAVTSKICRYKRNLRIYRRAFGNFMIQKGDKSKYLIK